MVIITIWAPVIQFKHCCVYTHSACLGKNTFAAACCRLEVSLTSHYQGEVLGDCAVVPGVLGRDGVEPLVTLAHVLQDEVAELAVELGPWTLGHPGLHQHLLTRRTHGGLEHHVRRARRQEDVEVLPKKHDRLLIF